MRKDWSLDELAKSGNVAQFVAFDPSGLQTRSRVLGYEPNHNFNTIDDALTALLSASRSSSINLRSFTPESPRSREFVYGVTSVHSARDELWRLNEQGLFVIANETVDVGDGGVSGVIEAGVIEFSPDDTPRCVEKPGTVSVFLQTGLKLLRLVYGFELELPETEGHRIEFSIHPLRQGYNRTHTLLWEYEAVDTSLHQPGLVWPNRFSQIIGDKAFGLLIAHLLGALVPRTLVFSRRLRPFEFGNDTGLSETWLRTCPRSQEPGKYTTLKGWRDPFELLETEDPVERSPPYFANPQLMHRSLGRPLHSQTVSYTLKAYR